MNKLTVNLKQFIAENSSLLKNLILNLNKKGATCCDSIMNDENVKKFLSDEELVYTAEHFFQSNLNISQASKSGYMHRNTLLYRIEKIEKILGLDIRKFEDALTLQVIMELHKFKTNKNIN